MPPTQRPAIPPVTAVDQATSERQPLDRLEQLLRFAESKWAGDGRTADSPWAKFVADYSARLTRARAIHAEVERLVNELQQAIDDTDELVKTQPAS